MKLYNCVRPHDRMLAGCVTPPAMIGDCPSYPYPVNRDISLLANSTCVELFRERWQKIDDTVIVRGLDAVYLHRPMRWWHRALNGLGCKFTDVKRVKIEGGGVRPVYDSQMNIPSVYVYCERFKLHITVERETSHMQSATSDMAVLGFDLDGVRQTR